MKGKDRRTQIQLLIKLFWVHHQQKELVRVIEQTLQQKILKKKIIILYDESINHAYLRINAYF